jgi:hypothetical protein
MAIGSNTMGVSQPKVIGASIWLLKPILIFDVYLNIWGGRLLVKKSDCVKFAVFFKPAIYLN